jgi:hypothetical protein
MSVFKASVQYNDYKGTVAADRSDDTSMRDYLKELGKFPENSAILGYSIGFNENSSREIEKPGLVVYVGNDMQAGEPDSIDAIELELTTAQFFKFLKRFSLVMTINGRMFDEDKVRGPYYD